MDFQRTNQQIGAGLTRYRSAPSSYFSSYLDVAADTIISGGGGSSFGGDDLDHFLNKFMPNNRINNPQVQDSNSNNNSFSNSMIMQQPQSQFVVASMKQEPEIMRQPQQLQQQGSQKDYSQVSQQHIMYQSQAPAHQAQPQQNAGNTQVPNASAVDNSYRLLAPMKMGNAGGNSNLTRYNSSPAGLFANIDIENEYGAMRGIGNFGAGNNAHAEASFSTPNSFKGQMEFSSAQASSSGLMPTISEIGSTGVGEHNPAGDTNFVEGHSNDSGYMTGFPVASWDDSTILSDSFLKGLGDDHEDNKNLSNEVASENQNNKGPNRPPTLLSHHLSLPKTSDEFSAIETLMQDSVLCKLRAKRGCATHPRSIAERVRRTRISERMRKLQELVPNMDKQTNTADMLDLAVDYIKDLQKQVQSLSDNRAKCTCLNQ